MQRVAIKVELFYHRVFEGLSELSCLWNAINKLVAFTQLGKGMYNEKVFSSESGVCAQRWLKVHFWL